ncbi:hypothetical protein D3C78_580700 [compost metagenome]
MDFCNQCGCFQRMSTTVEEMIVKTYTVLAESQFPQIRKFSLRRSRAWIIRCIHPSGIMRSRVRQCFRIDLSISCQRQLFQWKVILRQHKSRQSLCKPSLQLIGSIPFPRRKVCAQASFTVYITFGCYVGFADIRMLHQLGFNFSDFNPKASNFHLMIDPAEKINVAVWQPPRIISGLIHDFSRYKRILDEPFGC